MTADVVTDQQAAILNADRHQLLNTDLPLIQTSDTSIQARQDGKQWRSSDLTVESQMRARRDTARSDSAPTLPFGTPFLIPFSNKKKQFQDVEA